MEEKTLNGHLLELSRSVDDYRAAVKKAQDLFSFEVEKLWDDQAALRDELHTSLEALSNRVEGLTTITTKVRLPYSGSAQVCPGCSGSGEQSGNRCPKCNGFGEVLPDAAA